MTLVVLRRKVFRIGVQTLYRLHDRYYVSIQNRTYFSKHEVPKENVGRWMKFLEP